MSFCTNCGAEIGTDARFCPKCGKPAPAPAEVATQQPAAAAPPPPPVIPAPAVPSMPAASAPPPQAQASAARPAHRTTAERVPVTNTTATTQAKATTGYTPVTPQKRSTWWIVPAVIVGLVIIAWLFLAGLPFGGEDGERVAENNTPTDTIAEGTTTAQNQPITGTLIEVPGGDPNQIGTTGTTDTTDTIAAAGTPPPTATTAPPQVIEDQPTTSQPPVRATPAPTPVPQPSRPPQRATPAPTPAPQRPAPVPPRTQPTPPRTQPAPVRTPPAAPAPSPRPAGEISDAEGAATLRSFITSNTYYEGVTGDCVQVRSHGYRNVGYTYSVWDGCMAGGGSRMLGRWRVDSKTREVFRQREDGRFLRP